MNIKESIFFQTIFTVSLDIFIYLYTEYNPYFIAIGVVLSGVAIYNITNLIRDRRLIEIEPLSILTISFLIFALNGLGSREAPQTFEKIDKSINREIGRRLEVYEGERSLR